MQSALLYSLQCGKETWYGVVATALESVGTDRAKQKKEKEKQILHNSHSSRSSDCPPVSNVHMHWNHTSPIRERRLHCSLSVSTTARLLDRCLLVCLLVGGLCGRVWVDVYGRGKKGDRIFIPLLRLLPGQHGTNFLYHRSS